MFANAASGVGFENQTIGTEALVNTQSGALGGAG
jgi:hypothetical protein